MLVLYLNQFQQATVHMYAAELNNLDAHMQQWVRLPPEAWVHITTLICFTVGLWLFDISEGFCATSTTEAYIFHAFPSRHLNCDERWRSTGFSYTIKIKPLRVPAVGKTLRHVDHTGVKGSRKATRAGLTCSLCSLKVVLGSVLPDAICVWVITCLLKCVSVMGI